MKKSQQLLLLAAFLVSIGLAQAQSNPPPFAGTRITFPLEGAVYASTLDIKLRISNTNLTNLKLYSDDQLLASFTPTPPMAFVSPTLTYVTNFSVGSHTLYSVGNDSVTSAPVHIRVLAPLAGSPLSPQLGTAPEANASFVIDSNGALFDFGDGRFGALGDGGVPNQEPSNVTRPIQIPLPDGTNRFIKVSSGAHHTLALTTDGNLWTCGDNSSGQTGTGTNRAIFTRFQRPDFQFFTDIAAGNTHSLALNSSGMLFACGNNSSGQLGLGNVTNVSSFQFVPFPTNVTAWTAIGAGSNYSIALGNNGRLYACGLGLWGTLGTGGLTNSSRFTQVALPTAVTNWLKVAAGAQHVLAIAGNGALYTWGLGASRISSLPEPVTPPAGVSNWLAIAGGFYHSLGVGNDGNIYGWGSSPFGQLGPGALSRSIPTLIPAPAGITSWKNVGAGINHSLAIGSDCTLYAWGANNFGQLGIGSTTNQTNEVVVSNLGDLCAPPIITITYPPDGAVYSAPATILIGAEASSHDGGIGRLDLFENGILLASGTNTPFSFIWSNIVQGTYVLTAAAADTINPTSFATSAPVRITVGSSNTLPVVSVVATDAQAAEPPPTNNGTFTFFRAGNLQSPLTVLFRMGGTATLNTDYQTSPPLQTGASNMIYFRTIPANSNSATLTVVPLADTNVEPPETVVLTVFTNLAYALGYPNGAIVTILNSTNSPPPPPPPVLNLVTTDSQAHEQPGPNGVDTASFTVIRTGGSNFVRFPITVSGTATYGVDYYTVPGFPISSNSSTAIFELQSNQTSLAFTLYPIQDNLVEGTETAIFSLGSNTSYTLGPSNQSVINISDGAIQSSNSPPVITISSTDTVASEMRNSDGSTNTANFTIQRAGDSTNLIQVALIVDGTAIYGLDYYTVPPLNVTSNSHTAFLTMTGGPGTIPFTLFPLTDNAAEGTEIAMFTIGTNGSYTIGSPNQTTIFIISNQPLPTLTRIFFPPDGAIFASPQDIELRVTNTDIQTLKLYADNQLLATASQFGTFVFNYVTNFTPGSHTVYAVRDGSVTSAPVHFSVIATNALNPNSPSLGKIPAANSSFVIDANGALFDWGSDAFANLGDGGVSNTLFFAGVTLPIQIPLPTSRAAWAKVASGGQHTMALDSLGNLYAAGDNSFGQIGVGSSSSTFTNVPLSVTRILRSKDVAAGNSHSLALTTDGQIYAWGYNDFGQLGNGTTTNAPFPRPVSFPHGVTNWTAIAAGNYHSLALGNDGNAYAWGYAEFGALGNGAFTNASLPQRVVLPAGVTNWLKIAAGGYHNLALAGNGKLYAWGYGGVGTLGYGGTTNSSIPIPVNTPSNIVHWSAVSAGILHSIALAEDGSLYGWGDNSRGQLGPNASSLQPVPFLIMPPSGVQSWQQISAGAFHNLAIADGCMLYSWGSNSLGQLGVGSFVQQTNLQLVHNLGDLCTSIVVTQTNHAPSFVKGPDITVPENAGIQVFTNWATQINPGAPSETNQTLTFIVTNDNPHLFSTQPGIVPSGSLFFTGAPNSNGIAHVTIVLKDNGGTANGGQDTSAPQTFLITIVRPNSPPLPVVRVFPSFVLSSNYSAFQVISPNDSNALVYFDASLSSDADGDPLTFTWFDHGTNHLFGSTVVATNVLAIETYSLLLTVTDGHVTVFDPFEVEVISAGNAVGELINLIQSLEFSHPDVKPNAWKQLMDSLQAAQSEFDKGLWNVGLGHMRIFELRVLTQIKPTDPGLANTLIYIAQQIIGAVQGNAKQQPTINLPQNRGGNHKSISFAGAAGQVYLVQVSSDLSHWETIGIPSETDPGTFQFDDANSSVASARFYRLVAP